MEFANGAAVDARKESKVLQDLVLAEKRCEKKKKKTEDGARKKASTTNKRKPSGKENGDMHRRGPWRTRAKLDDTCGNVVGVC